jgi:peptide/nickel transport system ATP-binding protein
MSHALPYLLEVEDLKVGFQTDHGLLEAVDGVSFKLQAGQTLGLVGESGCGKSVTARALMRLLEYPSGTILGGSVKLNGREILSLDLDEMRSLRGNEIAMIFQEPMSALNPVHRVGKQIIENIRLHQKVSPSQALKRAIELMEWVGIPAPDKRVHEYPHQLSGGMRQRVMIAMALSCNPKVLIADEPTTALDVTVQAQILDLIKRLQRETGMGVILITHDLGVVAETCDEVAVMYAGRLVERAPVDPLFAQPKHAYTRSLLASIPSPDTPPKTLLKTIPGSVPSIRNYIRGSRFAARLGVNLTPEERDTRPAFQEIQPHHWVENCPHCVL